MAKSVAVVIQEDPCKTHRPVEALRIALGLVAGAHLTTVVLLGEAVRLLGEDVEDVVDVDILEKYLPSIKQLEVPFLLPMNINRPRIQIGFSVKYESEDEIRRFIHSSDRVLVF